MYSLVNHVGNEQEIQSMFLRERNRCHSIVQGGPSFLSLLILCRSSAEHFVLLSSKSEDELSK